MPFRVDTVRLDAFSVQPDGSLRIDAYPTRAGVLVYRTADGGTVRELRPPAEVFAPESLATLASRAVTDLHPAEGQVTLANRRALSVGHVGDSVVPHEDGQRVKTSVYVYDPEMIQAIQDGTRKELSAGYYADTVEQPGVFEGQGYDRIQSNIRYNHLAIGPEGWGRAGPQCALRTDDAYSVLDESAPAGEAAPMALRIDGKDFDPSTPEAQAAIAALESDRNKVKGSLAAAEAKAADLTKRLDAANDPKRLTEAVQARVQLLADYAGLRRLHHTDAEDAPPDGEKLSGMSAVDIMKDAITRWNPSIKLENQSDDFVLGVFASMVADLLGGDAEADPAMTDALPPPKASPPEMELQQNGGRVPANPLQRARDSVNANRGGVRRDARGFPVSGQRADGSDDDSEAKQYTDNSERWQKPLSASKGT